MKPIALIAALAAAAVGQHWDIEQVDSAGWGDGVQMRWHPDGRLFLCYSDTSGAIRLASYDTVWQYENVPTDSQPDPSSQAFDIGLTGSIGIAYCSGAGVRFIEKTDSGWAETSTELSSFGSRPLPAYYPDGAFGFLLDQSQAVKNVVRDDSTWLVESVAGVSAFTYWTWANRVVAGGRQVCAISWFWGSLLMSGSLYGVRTGGSWQTFDRWSVLHGDVAALGCDTDTLDTVRMTADVSSWEPPPHGAFYYEETQIAGGAALSVLDIDAVNRPQIAYACPELNYTYGDSSGWHNQVVDGRSVLALDLVLSEICQPIVAYANDGGVFIARGVDVAGQSEERQRPSAIGRQLTASVIRNVLLLPKVSSLKPQATSWLVDAAGRRALALHPGANDVSSLAPGVYFVREAQTQAVRKVVVAR